MVLEHPVLSTRKINTHWRVQVMAENIFGKLYPQFKAGKGGVLTDLFSRSLRR